MFERLLLVVGNKFAAFATGADVVTLSQACDLADMPQVGGSGHARIVLLPGQGLGDKAIVELMERVARSPYGHHFDVEALRRRPARASRRLSHKHRPENTLISEPRQVEEDVFEMDLLIDEDGELMCDHQTGQHVQGMVLFEAARQSIMAVAEAFFLPADGGYAFVTNEMSSRYSRFAFPVDARVRYTIREKEVANARRMRFVADIVVEQCGMEAASFHTDVTVFEQTRISRMEGAMARDTLSQHLAGRAADARGELSAVA